MNLATPVCVQSFEANRYKICKEFKCLCIYNAEAFQIVTTLCNLCCSNLLLQELAQIYYYLEENI